jgi:hypothetical protein
MNIRQERSRPKASIRPLARQRIMPTLNAERAVKERFPGGAQATEQALYRFAFKPT